ncbi:MAG: TonB-dependent receptor [Sedimentisphaerales bacterium]|jgi:iron complex outermembrane receptor protein
MRKSKKELKSVLSPVLPTKRTLVTLITCVAGQIFNLESNVMKTRGIQPATKWLLLLPILMVINISSQTAVAKQEEPKQKTDLTELSMEDLMNVEVVSTATLTKTTPRLVPAAVTTITAEQIKASGARSLYELLDIYVPNLQVIHHHWESDHMGLRGTINDRDDKYLLLVNGRVMNEHTHYGALTERDLVMLQDIHHIDVVRGSGSALYGPGAISMVINIVTFNANTFKGTEMTGRMGAIEEFYSGEVKHSHQFDDNDGGIFVYAGGAKYDGASKYDAPQIFPYNFPNGPDAGDPFTNAPINRDGQSARNEPPAKMHIELTKGDWDIWGRYTRGGQQFPWAAQGLTPAPVGYGVTPVTSNFYSYQQMTGFIGHKQELTKNIDIDYSVSYETTDFTEFRQNSTTNAYREDEYHGKILLQWTPNEQHKIALGSEISHRELGLKSPLWPDIAPVSMQLSSMPQWSTNMYSLLGEWQWNINSEWTTFLGGRIDKHTYTDLMLSPRAAIIYSPTEKDTLKLMWSRSVRANVEEEMKRQAMTSGGTSTPEKLDTLEFRYERQQSKNFDLATSIFMHYNFELVSWDESTHSSTTVGKQEDWGAELEASYHTEKTRLTLSHGYTKLIEFNLVPGKDTYATAKPYGYGDDLSNWSNHITKLTAQQKLDDKWTLNASFRIYWGFPGTKDYNKYYPILHPGGGQFIEDGWEKAYRGDYFLNLGLQYKPNKNLTIGITGYNLLGIFNIDLNKRNYLDSNGDYRCEAPAIGVSVEYKF